MAASASLMLTASGSIRPLMALYSRPAGDTRTAAFSESLFSINGVLTYPPSRKLLTSPLAENVSNEPSFERSLMCDELRLPSSEEKPPTWNSATETTSGG